MNGRTSESHTSAVNVLRMVGTRHEHQAAEPVPFRARPSGPPLRSIKPPRKPDGNACYSRPGVMCMHDARCHDTHCEGHPCNDPQDHDVPESERDPALLIKTLAVYVAFLAACAWGTWHWLSN